MKRGLLILLCSLALILLLGCNSKQVQMEVETSQPADEEVKVTEIETGADCDIYESDDKRYQCYKDYVNKKLEFAGCSEIKDSNHKQLCYTAVALHNISICDGIYKPLPRNKREKINATFRCIGGTAIATGDHQLCNRTNNTLWADRCYTGVAVDKEDVAICQETILDETALDCFSSVAANTGIEACDTADNAIYESDIRYRCYIDFALEKQSLAACRMIKSELWHDKCLRELSVKDNNATICQSIIRPDIRDECFRSFALAKSDLSVCDIMSSREDRYECYKDIALSHQDLSMCELIELVGTKYKCYTEIATNLTNVSICEQIDGHDDRNECYVEIAVKTGDPSFCYAMKAKVGNKNECYHRVAVENEDETICEIIDYEYDRNACLDAVEEI